jgi:hypothetical protein
MSRKRKERRPRFGDLPLSFGRFVGKPIKNVPRDYLEWAISEGATIPAADRWAIQRFLRETAAKQGTNHRR